MPAIVLLRRWRDEREELLRRNDPVGVRLASDEAPGAIEEISGDLERLGVVVLEFASFTDGRPAITALRHGARGDELR